MPKHAVLLSQKLNKFIEGALADQYELLDLPEEGVSALGARTADVRAVIAFGAFSAEQMDALPNLEIIACPGVGYDGIDTTHARDRGIIVTHTPGVLNDEVADTAVALLLNTIRQFYFAEKWVRDGRWEHDGAFALSPFSLKGRKVGLYGLGRIGEEIAARLEPFKVEIAYHTRTPKKNVPYAYHPTLASLADAVDTLIAIVPKTEETHKTINADILNALGPEGILVNVGRGWTVDEDDLIAALEAGTLGGAGLDVFYDEPHVPEKLLTFETVSVLPHVASASVSTRRAMGQLVADNLSSWFSQKRPITPVPETPVPPQS